MIYFIKNEVKLLYVYYLFLKYILLEIAPHSI